MPGDHYHGPEPTKVTLGGPSVVGAGLKLYVWNNPVSIRYGSSFLVVPASSLEEAQRWGDKEVKSKSSDGVRAQPLGEPDEILDLPAAVYREWSE